MPDVVTLRGLAAVLGAAAAFSCRSPTQITVEVTTDVPCKNAQTAIAVGQLGPTLELKPAASTREGCDAEGRVGTLVVVPSGDKDDEVAIRVVTSSGVRPEDCKTNDSDCIIARRALHFVPHTELVVPVRMKQICAGQPCSPTETCVDRVCKPATIQASKCSGNGCTDDELWPAPVSDAGPELCETAARMCSGSDVAREEEPCGPCDSGVRARTRSCVADTCQWGPWSAWSECAGVQAPCTPDQVDTATQSCGGCGFGTQSRTRTCGGSCTWGDWGEWSDCTACTPNHWHCCHPSGSTAWGWEWCDNLTCKWSGTCSVEGCAANPLDCICP